MKSPVSEFTPGRLPCGGTSRKLPGVSSKFDQPAEDRERFDAHLSVCDGCTFYVEQMRETIRLAGMLTEGQVPVEQRERLRQAFRDWKTG